MATPEQRTEFIEAAIWHGPLDRANAILAEHPDLASSDIHTSAVVGGDASTVERIARTSPEVVQELVVDGGQVLAEFAGNDNTGGVRHLLDLGVPVNARFGDGDGYWDIAPASTALHVAAWRACHDTARLLIDRGADVNARDKNGQTPLLLAVRACVDSYWTEWRKPDTVAALLAAGATTEGVPENSGYDAVDALIAAHRRTKPAG